MSFKNKKKRRHRSSGFSLREELVIEAEEMLEKGDLSGASVLLQEATRLYPRDPRFWELFAEAASELEDTRKMLIAFRGLKQIRPRDPGACFDLACAYLLDERVALGYREFREFLQRFPGDERRPNAEQDLNAGESNVRLILSRFGFPEGEEGLELLCLHDESQVLMNLGELAEAKASAEELISRMPDFFPAYNNLSLIMFAGGDAEKAADAARATLVKHPNNGHALANLVRFSTFLGKEDDAAQYADRLRKLESDLPDVYVKKLEAFSFLGDDAGVVEAFELTKKSEIDFAEAPDLVRHLAAYSYCRLGNEKKARRLWREIVRENRDFDLAEYNLEELYMPKYKRELVALPTEFWIPPGFIEDIVGLPEKVKKNRNFEKNLQKKLVAFFEKTPGITRVLAMMLDRGDDLAKEAAIQLLSSAGTTGSIAALKEFAFGESGSDEIRYKAATALAESGFIPNNVDLWREGELRPMRLITFEVTGEPTSPYPLKPKATAMSKRGMEAMFNGKFDLAEQYFLKALAIDGAEHPSLLYNLLSIEQAKGNAAEADAALVALVQKFPDYPIGAITLARLEVKKGNTEGAKDLTAKFYDKKKWHVSEICVWLYFNIELGIAEKQFDSARSSLEILESFDDNLDYDYWESLITRAEIADTMPGLSSKSAKR